MHASAAYAELKAKTSLAGLSSNEGLPLYRGHAVLSAFWEVDRLDAMLVKIIDVGLTTCGAP